MDFAELAAAARRLLTVERGHLDTGSGALFTRWWLS